MDKDNQRFNLQFIKDSFSGEEINLSSGDILFNEGEKNDFVGEERKRCGRRIGKEGKVEECILYKYLYCYYFIMRRPPRRQCNAKVYN